MENRRKVKVVPMQIGTLRLSNIDKDLARQKALMAEPTGKGNLLVIDGFFGRMFRSDEGCVREENDEFIRQYNDICRRFDEDPAHQYFEVMNWNDLNMLHGIVPGLGQDGWGYTNSEDYRVELKFRYEYVTEGEWVDKFGEPYLIFWPCECCQPDPCYMEV